MKRYLLALSVILAFSTIARAQWHGQSAGFGGSCSGLREVRVPDVPNPEPPFIKGPMPLSQTWNSSIASFGNNPDGLTITCFAEDSDNLYVGGDFLKFDTVHSQFIVQYNRKTKLWATLDAGLDNGVEALAIHDGKLYVAGYFRYAGASNQQVNYIATWDGTSWHDLGGGMNGAVHALTFVGDTLYAGGEFTLAGMTPASFLAFWDGNAWQEAYGGVSYPVLTLASSHDSLFVGGHFNYVGSETSNTGLLVQGSALLKNGTWSSLGVGYYSQSMVVLNGKLWAAGYYYISDGNQLVNGIASWDGASWTSYGPDTSIGTASSGDIYHLTVLGDTLFALGGFSTLAGVPAEGIAMYHNGAWSEFGGGVYGEAYAVIPFDGSLYVGGRYTKAGTVDAFSMASYTNGNWTSIGRQYYNEIGWESAEVTAIATSPRYVAIGGNFEAIAHIPCNHVALWDKQFDSWTTLGAGVDGNVRALAFKGDTLVVGGGFNHAGTVTSQHIALYNVITHRWYAMGRGAHRFVAAISVYDDSIFAPIFYNKSPGGAAYDNLGVWNDTGWVPYGNGLEVGYIWALAWQRSTLYAAGEFAHADDGTTVNGIAQLIDGSWGALSNGLDNNAYALAVSGDSVYVGGQFLSVDGFSSPSLAVWNGTRWNPIGDRFSGPVEALAADGNGGVYAGGNFSSVAGVNRGALVHWKGLSYGTVAGGVDNTVAALATDETALYAGGWFETAGTSHTTSLHFGALDGAGAGVNATSAQSFSPMIIHPNPASAISTVSLDLTKPSDVRLDLFNSVGSRIATIANGFYESGPQQLLLDASKLSSGIYFLRLTCDGIVTTQHFVVSH